MTPLTTQYIVTTTIDPPEPMDPVGGVTNRTSPSKRGERNNNLMMSGYSHYNSHNSQHESDSGYSLTSGSPHSQEGTLGDTEAGPDIADIDIALNKDNFFLEKDNNQMFDEAEFRPATEVFSNPGFDLDYLNTHGGGTGSVSHLARESLYVKFDPLVGGRPSVMGRPSVAPYRRKEEQEEDLIGMNSPSPVKPGKRTSGETTITNESSDETRHESSSELGHSGDTLGHSGDNTVLLTAGEKEETQVTANTFYIFCCFAFAFGAFEIGVFAYFAFGDFAFW